MDEHLKQHLIPTKDGYQLSRWGKRLQMTPDELIKDKALRRLAGMGGDAVVKKLHLEGQPEKIKAVHELAQMGYKNVHDKAARKPPTHKD